MAEVQKGVVTSVEGLSVRVKPDEAGELVTPYIACDVSPIYIGDTVAYVLFEDGAGVVLKKI